MIKYIQELKREELKDKKVLMRVGFDVPLTQSLATNGQLLTKIQETFRIKAHKETLDFLIGAGAKVMLVSHLGHEVSGASFGPVVEEVGELLGHTITLVPHSELASVAKIFEAVDVLLLDNIRQDPRELENDDSLAVSLSSGFDYYVNDDFATAHRSHASVVAITKHLPAYAGFLIKKETENLKKAISAPSEGKILVLGGAKMSTKLPVIKNFLDKADKILIGGAIANNFFKANGVRVGSSVADETPIEVQNEKIVLPQDMMVADNKSGGSYVEARLVQDIGPEELIIDIGPQTAEHYTEIIDSARFVIWNGPMGLSEVEKFAKGTGVIANAVAQAQNSLIGGGDTVAFVDKLGLLDKYGFVSTGGGSMLEFLAGNQLPGLAALEH